MSVICQLIGSPFVSCYLTQPEVKKNENIMHKYYFNRWIHGFYQKKKKKKKKKTTTTTSSTVYLIKESDAVLEWGYYVDRNPAELKFIAWKVFVKALRRYKEMIVECDGTVSFHPSGSICQQSREEGTSYCYCKECHFKGLYDISVRSHLF